MAFNITIPSIPAKTPSVTPQPGAKHFDIVLGFDFHLLKVPWPGTPCPVTPFSAIIFDPMDYIHITLPAMPVYSSQNGFEISTGAPAGSGIQMGGTVTINGCYRAAADTGLMALPPMLPLGPMLKKVGLKVKPPNPLHFAVPKAILLLNPLAPHDGQIAYGSKTVLTQQSNQSALMCNVWSCNEIGQVVLNNPTALFANYATKIIAVLPLGNPVMVGGPFIEKEHTFADLVNALIMMGIMKGAAALLSRIMNALLKKLNSFLDAHPKIRDAVQPLVCRFLGEPVDVASGNTTSLFQGFSLPGPIPFTWEANYYSDSKYEGPLGKNVYHSYDFSLFIDEKLEMVVLKDNAGRAVPFPLLERGQSFFNPMEKFELHRSNEGEYYVNNKEGQFYYFTHETFSDGWRQLRSIANRNGFAIRFYYNSEGHLNKITDSAHRNIELKNNPQGRITEILLPHPDKKWDQFTVLKYEYDLQGRITAFYDALNYVNRLEWKERLITVRQFKDGTIFTFSYDKAGRCYAALGPNGLYSYHFEYKNGFTIVENSLGYKSFYYHNKGIVIRIVDSRGGQQTFTYDFFNNLVSEQDEIGNVKNYEYDLRGNITGIGLPGQGATKIEYNNLNLPVKRILPNGAVWEYEYGTEGNLIKKTNPLGAATTFNYSDGLLSTIVNATGNSTQLLNDKEYNLVQVKFPNQSKVIFEYDRIGRCISITDSNGNHQLRTFDLLNNIVEVNQPDGNIRKLRYNAMGKIIQATDKNHDIHFTCNFFGYITRRTEAGASIYFKYDTQGQLISIVNEQNENYVLELGSEGDVIKEVGFDGITRRYERNLAGQITTVFRPAERRTTYEYDTAGRATLIQYSDGIVEEFAYDAMGGILKAKNNQTEVSFKRNLLGQVIVDKQGENIVTSEYNKLGNRVQIRSSLGADINIDYNPLTGWSEKIESDGWQAEIERNKFGQEIKRNINGNLSVNSSYDKVGKMEQQSVSVGQNISRKRQYSWDIGNRLKAINDTHFGTKRFVHDTYGNLSEVIYADSAIEYRMPDTVGNLFTSPDQKDRTYGKAGKLLKDNDGIYEYDEEGFLIRKRLKSADEWRYIWNDNGSLQKVIQPNGNEVTFEYDALNRRLSKKYKKTITRWVWDGNAPLHEWKEFEAKESEADDLITWIFEENSFIPSAKKKGDKKYCIIGDQIGTPYSMYNEAGETIWECDLDSYGKPKTLTGELGSCPFRYQGQYEDAETGLYYNRFRYYDPKVGVFISQDPIGLNGSIQPYMYTINPTIIIDPLGLAGTVDDDGFFAPSNEYGRGNGNGRVDIEYQGTRNRDFTQADNAFREKTGRSRPEGYTWHHATYDPNTGIGTMQLVKTSVHGSTSHSGGVAIFQAEHGIRYGDDAVAFVQSQNRLRGRPPC